MSKIVSYFLNPSLHFFPLGTSVKVERPSFLSQGSNHCKLIWVFEGLATGMGNLDPHLPSRLSASIPNFVYRFQVQNKAVLTSSLCVWAICRFLTTLDSQAWEIAWARIKQESKLEFQLCTEHFWSRDDITGWLPFAKEPRAVQFCSIAVTFWMTPAHLRLRPWAGLTLPPSVQAASWQRSFVWFLIRLPTEISSLGKTEGNTYGTITIEQKARHGFDYSI